MGKLRKGGGERDAQVFQRIPHTHSSSCGNNHFNASSTRFVTEVSKMKIIIEAEVEEIAALVVALQERRECGQEQQNYIPSVRE